MPKTILTALLFLFTLNLTTAQELQNGQKRWSLDSPLTLEDFKIKTATDGDDAVYSQFLISHAVGGITFLKRNFNKNVETVYLGNAS